MTVHKVLILIPTSPFINDHASNHGEIGQFSARTAPRSMTLEGRPVEKELPLPETSRLKDAEGWLLFVVEDHLLTGAGPITPRVSTGYALVLVGMAVFIAVPPT